MLIRILYVFAFIHWWRTTVRAQDPPNTIFRYQCPQGCFCVPDIIDVETLIISCKWTSITSVFTPAFPKNATKSLSIQCHKHQQTRAVNADENNFGHDIFVGFKKLRELRISNCKTHTLSSETFRGMPNLKSLYLSHINNGILTVNKQTFVNLRTLEKLTIVNSGIEEIQNGALCSLPLLHVLNFSTNQLTSASLETTECILDHLIILDVSGNKFKKIGGTDFNAFPSIRQLRLSSNGIQMIEADAFKSINLIQHLDLDENELTEIPSLPDNLLHINLAKNQLNIIPATIANLPSLVSLNLSENFIDSSTPFSLLSAAIEMLDLSRNHLTHIPQRLAKESIETIVALNLAENNLAEIELFSFQNFTHLQELDLSSNGMRSLPYGVFNGLHQLTSLQLNNNSISHVDIEVFSEFSNKLTTLGMSNNKLDELPMAIGRLSHAKSIDLSGNSISKAYKFVINKISHLSRLDLSNNNLETVESYVFSDSAHLTELILRNNKIETINNDAFEKCPRLKKLDLSENRLKFLQNSLKNIDSLRLVNISSNQFDDLDWSQIPNGVQELVARNNRIKIISRAREGMDVKIIDLAHNDIDTIEHQQSPPLLEEIILRNNYIRELSNNSFAGKTQLKSIDIRNNLLTRISKDIFEQSQTININFPGQLSLSGNPLICDCELAWILNSTAKRIAINIVDVNYVQCTLPLSSKTRPISSVSADDYVCSYKQTCGPSCICCQYGNCDCRSKCPDGCDCFHDNTYKLNIVKCHSITSPENSPKFALNQIPMHASHIYLNNVNLPILHSNELTGRIRLSQFHLVASNLKSIEPLAFNTLPKLRVLNLSGNKLRMINGDESFKTQRMQKLNIEGNEIIDIDPRLAEIMPNLEVLFAAGNSFEELPKYFKSDNASKKVKSVTIGDNPLRCDCSQTRRFEAQHWIVNNKHRINDIDKVYCVENITRSLLLNDTTVLSTFPPNIGKDLFTMPMLEFIHHENRSICLVKSEGIFGGTHVQNTFLISLVIVCITLIIVALFYIFLVKDKNSKAKNRYKKANSSNFSPTNTPGCSPLPSGSNGPLIQYDAFISYSKEDESEVINQLCGILEAQDMTLCLLHQDGVSNYKNDGFHKVSEELNRQLEASQTLIILLTKRFLENEWLTVQIRHSHQCFARMRGKKLITIISEEINPNKLEHELGQIVRKSTYIQKNHQLFWSLLLSALPKRESPACSETSQIYSDVYGSVVVPSDIV